VACLRNWNLGFSQIPTMILLLRNDHYYPLGISVGYWKDRVTIFLPQQLYLFYHARERRDLLLTLIEDLSHILLP